MGGALERVFILSVDPCEEIRDPLPPLTTEDVFNMAHIFSDDSSALQVLM